jgi:hypothetical protein
MKSKSGLIQISVLRVVTLHSMRVATDISGKNPTVLYLQPHIIKQSSVITIIFYEIQIKFLLSHIMKACRGVEV